MEITTQRIKEVRDLSGAGIMDCRNALIQAKGDQEKALQILKEQNLLRVEKKSDRAASQGLIEAIANQGFDSIVVAGDTDVRMGIEAMEMIYNETLDTIALASRDADFLPILVKSKEYGKDTIVIGAEPGFSIALQNAADTGILMGQERPRDLDEEEDLEV